MTRLAYALVAFMLLVSSAAHANQSKVDYEALYANPEAQAAFIRAKIREYFPRDYHTMIAIANCESTGLIHWKPDGSLLPHHQGASSSAGVFQVLLYGHRHAIAKHGLDMNNIDDYLTFVKMLRDGRPDYGDWNASRKCWQTRLAQN